MTEREGAERLERGQLQREEVLLRKKVRERGMGAV